MRTVTHKEYLAIRGVQEGAGTATVPCCPMSWPAGVAARQADRGITRRRSTASLCRESRLKAGLARRRAEGGACQDVIGLQGGTFLKAVHPSDSRNAAVVRHIATATLQPPEKGRPCRRPLRPGAWRLTFTRARRSMRHRTYRHRRLQAQEVDLDVSFQNQAYQALNLQGFSEI